MKMQILTSDSFQRALLLLRHWLPGEPLAQPGSQCLPEARPPHPLAAAAVSAELVRLDSLGLAALPPGQLVLLLKDSQLPAVGCVLIPFSTPAVGAAPPASRPAEGPATGWLRQLHEALEKNLADPAFTVEQLAGQLAMSPKSLLRKVQALLRVSPKECMQHYRLRRAAGLLADGYRVGEVADLVGFNSATHFGQCFKKLYGVSPSQYLSWGEGESHLPAKEQEGLKSEVFCPKSEGEQGESVRNIALSILR